MDSLDDLHAFFEVNGYATLRSALLDDQLTLAESELVLAQQQLVEGALDAHGTDILDDPEATIDELRDENKRLKAALKRAELEREILKKATAFFARESP